MLYVSVMVIKQQEPIQKKKIKAYRYEKSSNYKEDKKRGRKEQTNYKTENNTLATVNTLVVV